MENLPLYIPIAFVFTTLFAIFIFLKAINYNRPVIVTISIWLLMQAIVAKTGFYTFTNTTPPRFLLLIGAPVVAIVICFASKSGRRFIDSIDIKTLNLIHLVRIPVELIFIGFLNYKLIPQIMTFEGSNFDILSGITCLAIYYWGYIRHKISRPVLIVWNLICLGLLINIVAIAILSAPFRFQQFGFDQPNIAVLYAPYIWLPCCIVPMVLFAHMVSMRALFNSVGKKQY